MSKAKRLHGFKFCAITSFSNHCTNFKQMKAIVSAEWLYESRNNPHIILLDASPKSNKSGLQAKNPGLQLPNARVVDLKQDFSDPKSNLPNTLLSEADFEQTARRLGINEDSYIVVYDNLADCVNRHV